MKYLKFNAFLLEVSDDYHPEYVNALFNENGIKTDSWEILNFEQLSSDDKIRALTIRLKDTERQLEQWRKATINLRANWPAERKTIIKRNNAFELVNTYAK